MSRKSLINSSFARAAGSYDSHCEIQARVAQKLAGMLPALRAPDVLELGCGTGQFTRLLFDRFSSGHFVISDACAAMTARCERSLSGEARNAVFQTADGDKLTGESQYDLIASSLALHWFDEPVGSLERQRAMLRPGGQVVFAMIGDKNFSEWRQALEMCSLNDGTQEVGRIPGIIDEDFVAIDYGDARGFLDSLKKTGAVVPRDGYQPLSPTDLRRACHALDQLSRGRVTWHIVYGAIDANGPVNRRDSRERQLVAMDD